MSAERTDTPDLPWDAPQVDATACGLMVAVEGYEGPLDLLLALARTQKVDLAKISMLTLADQYLEFICDAANLRLEVAADYLVMAAWLAYLKSKLLLPRGEADQDPLPPEELAQRLTFRLMRLDAMRRAAAQLMERHRLGVSVFARGAPDPKATIRSSSFEADIYDLIKAYAEQRRRTVKVSHVVRARVVWSIKDARERLVELIGAEGLDWVGLDRFLEIYLPHPDACRTVLASSFGATLELARDGRIELWQDHAFGPLFLKDRETGTTRAFAPDPVPGSGAQGG